MYNLELKMSKLIVGIYTNYSEFSNAQKTLLEKIKY